METFNNVASLQEIEVRTSTSVKTFLVVIFTAILVLMIYKLPKQLFHLQKFNPNGVVTLAFTGIFILFIFSWMWLLDNRPKFIIKKDGFWVRKTILPFSALEMIAWKDIKHVEYDSVKQKRGRSFFLVIHRKESSKKKKMGLDEVDETIKDILSVIRKFATIMNYVDRLQVTQ